MYIGISLKEMKTSSYSELYETFDTSDQGYSSQTLQHRIYSKLSWLLAEMLQTATV